MEQNNKNIYSEKNFFIKIIVFVKWLLKDIYDRRKNGRTFNEYGLTMYCGRQGAGKTVAMVEYLERMRKVYPEAIIVTNFNYIYEDYEMKSWEDFLYIRNDEKGVIFAIDEIQNEFSNEKWKTFPEFLLREITQQRKQKIKIVATSQVFTRVVKQLREQCFEVVECKTLLGRWTFIKAFDAEDYNNAIDSPSSKENLTRLFRKNFIQDEKLRNLYDTYAKIEKLKDAKYIERDKRVI